MPDHDRLVKELLVLICLGGNKGHGCLTGSNEDRSGQLYDYATQLARLKASRRKDLTLEQMVSTEGPKVKLWSFLLFSCSSVLGRFLYHT